MTERMGNGARDHECANERMSACERGMEKKKEDAAISRLSRYSFRRGRGELSSDYSREFEFGGA